jgi:uncharacterized protein
MLTDKIKASIDESVLCWLATADNNGIPNCSPKEIFTHCNDSHILIANIASPESVANIKTNPEVCVSFIHVFKQKGFKIKGKAIYVDADNKDFQEQVTLVQTLAGDNFPVKGIIVVEVSNAKPIIAPGYYLTPGATEDSQIEGAKRTYGV